MVASLASGAAGATTQSHRFELDSPLGFERNQGQTDSRVDFATRGQGYALFLTSNEMVLSLQPAKSAESSPDAQKTNVGDVVRMQLRGAAARAQAEGVDLLPGKVNYLTGADQKQWRTNVPVYKAVKYASVYPGVDVVYYGKGRELEYDFVVAPGADPNAIALSFSGAKVDIDTKGDLVLAASSGDVRFHKPVVYQLDGDRRVQVAANYVREGSHGVKFEVGDYDRSRPLVIDPVLSYSTYLGGENGDTGEAISVDASGAVYVTGTTSSLKFPSVNPAQPAIAGGTDVYVAKLSSDGRKLLYSTVIGGSSNDAGNDIAVDAEGSAYLVGYTESADFPLVRPIQSTSASGEAFVLKLSKDGSALSYSTYLGGSANDEGAAIAVDGAGAAYVTGRTYSPEFPIVNAFQNKPSDSLNAFVTKIAANGAAFEYSTYLGGSLSDEGTGIAVDRSSSAYVTGWTSADDFPTANPLQAKLKEGSDAFVTKFAPSGKQLVYSTYLGGSMNDEPAGVAIDAKGAAYVVGKTTSSDFPTARAFRSKFAGDSEAFLAKIVPTGAALDFSTYLGGNDSDEATDVAVDPNGSANVVGLTWSNNFPWAQPLQASRQGGFDAFVSRFKPDGSKLEMSTYLGGSADDFARGVAVDGSGNTFITGSTSSKDFLTVWSRSRGADEEAFVTKLNHVPFGGKRGQASCQNVSQSGDQTGVATTLKRDGVIELEDVIREICRE